MASCLCDGSPRWTSTRTSSARAPRPLPAAKRRASWNGLKFPVLVRPVRPAERLARRLVYVLPVVVDGDVHGAERKYPASAARGPDGGEQCRHCIQSRDPCVILGRNVLARSGSHIGGAQASLNEQPRSKRAGTHRGAPWSRSRLGAGAQAPLARRGWTTARSHREAHGHRATTRPRSRGASEPSPRGRARRSSASGLALQRHERAVGVHPRAAPRVHEQQQREQPAGLGDLRRAREPALHYVHARQERARDLGHGQPRRPCAASGPSAPPGRAPGDST